MKTSSVLLALLLYCASGGRTGNAEQGVLAIKVSDTRNQPLKNVVVKPTGPGNLSTPTDTFGLTRMTLLPQTHAKDVLEIDIASPRNKFVFISPWDQRLIVPSFENAPANFVTVTLGVPGDRDLLSNDSALRAMASKVVRLLASTGDHEATPELRTAALLQVATFFGMDANDVDQSIRRWGTRIQDPYDKGIAALYEGNYSQAQDQLQVASDERAVDLQESIKKFADAKFFLGQCLYLQGKYQTAVDAFREVIRWRPDDPLVLNNLALNLSHIGNLSEAEALYRHSVDQQRASPTRDDFLFSQSIGSLGGVLLRENKLDAAEPQLREALAIRRQALPSDDPRIATSMSNLAVLLQLQGKLEEAETLLTGALQIQQNAVGTTGRCFAPSFQPRDSAINNLQQPASLTCSALVAESQRGLSATPSQSAIASTANNATALVRPISASTQLTATSEKGIVGLSSLAQQRPGISTTMCNLAILYVTMGNHLDKAESLAQNAIEAEKSTLPPNHPDLATSYEALGTVLAAEAKRSEAKIAFSKALEIRELNFGPNHIYLAELFEAIAHVEPKDNTAAAINDLDRALQIEISVWGNADPRTQTLQKEKDKLASN